MRLEPGKKLCEKVAGDFREAYGKMYRCMTGAYNALEILSHTPHERHLKLLEKELRDGAREKKPGSRRDREPTAPARDCAPLRCATRGQRQWKGKT